MDYAPCSDAASFSRITAANDESGLTVHVDDKTFGEVLRVLRRHDDPYAATRELVVAANAGGGTDNVSVIVVFAD